jgi:uncharacterized protein (TIGR03435 family)
MRNIMSCGAVNPNCELALPVRLQRERSTMESALKSVAPRISAARVALVCVLILLAVSASAQTTAARLEFEAASVKPHDPDNSSGRTGVEESLSLIRIENLSIKALVELAYGIKDFQLEGPGWMSTGTYDIDARLPEGHKLDELQPLLQSLLADRFKLTVHHGSKLLPGYALVVAKGGPRLQVGSGPKGYFTSREGLISGSKVPMDRLAGGLSRLLGSPVADETGLTGAYDVKLEWAPDEVRGAPSNGTGGDQGSTDPPDSDASMPSLRTALQEQLGLKLESKKIPVDTIVIDHVERPGAD